LPVETAFDGSKNSIKPSEEDYKNQKSSGSASKKSIIYLTIKPDQGGKEARDFCSIMLRMLVRYASDKKVTCEIT
jgi:protein subunit release factor A